MERKVQSQKFRQNETAKEYVSDEGARKKKPRRITKQRGDKQSSQKESRVMIIKMIQNLGKRMEAQIKKIQEMFSKQLEDIKNKQTEMNNTINKRKNTLEGSHSRINEAEEQISELEDRMVEILPENRIKKNENKRGQFKRPLGQH